MSLKIKIITALLIVSSVLCVVSNTYSRYVADTTGNIEMSFTKWQILVNETDIVNGNSSQLENIEPVIIEDENIASNKIAPTSKGYFDVDIDPSNVELSFEYEIALGMDNNNIPDLVIAEYEIITDKEATRNEANVKSITNNKIVGEKLFDKTVENFKFEPFTVRIYFKWIDHEDEESNTMSDEEDTEIGYNADDNKFRITANIKFQQKISE